jgi:hypothetical protein
MERFGRTCVTEIMKYWRRIVVTSGFEWVSEGTETSVSVQLKDSRWTAKLSVVLASSEREDTRFFAEDGYYASLEKCLLYVWRALTVVDRSTFDLQEALADLRRFVL